MNYLAHLFLSDNNPYARIGSLLADFVKIPNNGLELHFCQTTCRAIIVHREIDQFTDAHADVSSAIRFFFPKYRHYSRIIIDILFDHFLCKNWGLFNNQSLDLFVDSVYQDFRVLPDGLPQKFEIFTSRLIQFDILRAYISLADIHEVFLRVDKRLRNPVGMQNAVQECLTHYEELDDLFLSFFPQLINFVQMLSMNKDLH